MKSRFSRPRSIISCAIALDERDVGADVEPEPRIGPCAVVGPARIDHEQFGAVANAFQHVVKEDRMRLACIRTPQE